jgi:dolichol-phosphate mannosyltransferase
MNDHPRKSLIVIPTYNEAENIGPLLDGIREHAPETDVLFVDDNSPDGTGARIESARIKSPQSVHLIRRPEKLGLGTAYIAGFQWALESDYGVLVQMDADLSHDPADLPRILASLDTYDVVIGSRYVAGGGVKRWGVLRRCLSRFASAYARSLLGVRIRDLTGGFTGWRREALETIPLEAIRSEGYSFLIELKFRAYLGGLRIHEIPIVFVDRRAGRSKLSWRVIFEAVYRVWFLSLGRRSLAAKVNSPSSTPEERS